MNYHDQAYGETEISEPVILELIATKPFARIKDVNQAGTQLVQPHKKITRFEHCLGVSILLRNFGANLPEQVAGLLHDVPHTAFSHAVDFAFKENADQTYHEKFLKKVVFDSEIPTILKKYKIDPEFVTDEHNFSLLEQEIPNLCADRLDYIFRDLLNDKVVPKEKIDQILSALENLDGKFVMNDQKLAGEFAKLFMRQCLDSFNHPQTLASFELFGQLVRRCLDIKALTEEDLFVTDSEFIEKIKILKDPEVHRLLGLQTPDLWYELNDEDFDFETRGKTRYIDPLVTTPKGVKHLSELDPDFAARVEEFKQFNKKGFRLKVRTRSNK